MISIQKFSKWVSIFLRFTILVAAVIAFYDELYLTGFLSSLILILTFIPDFIEKRYKLFLPVEFEIFIIIFIYAALFLGEIRSYYALYWWWDIFLHTFSGIILGFIGFLIVYILNYEKKVRLNMSPFLIGIFSFTFSVAIGVLWEIFEFIMDTTFGFNMQKSGLVDTMTDLIVDTIGALVVAVLGYFYVKNVEISFFDKMVNSFINKNPGFMKKKRN